MTYRNTSAILAPSERIVQRGFAGIYSDMVGALVLDLGRQSEQKSNRERLGDDQSAAHRLEEIHKVRRFDQSLQ